MTWVDISQKKRYTNNHQVYEKGPTSHQGTTNQNHNEIISLRMAITRKTKKNASKDAKTVELSYTVGGDENEN